MREDSQGHMAEQGLNALDILPIVMSLNPYQWDVDELRILAVHGKSRQRYDFLFLESIINSYNVLFANEPIR